MSFFNKNKKPTLKKTATKNNSNKARLSKYLPTTLFIGIQEDVNEKALISYITSLSQSAFNNVREAKYSIHRLAKNKYLYEIHNGSETLTYLPLVISTVIEGGKHEIILKTNSQNVRVLKKTSTKIETNTLIESNNREDDAVVDYEANGKLKHLIKQGTEVFVVSSIAFAITGVLAGVSFVTKYYMLNEDYSFNPKFDIQMTAHDYLTTVESEHSQTKYIDSIEFIKGEWKTNYKEIEAPEAIVSIIEEKEPEADTYIADSINDNEFQPFDENKQEPLEPLDVNSLMKKAEQLKSEASKPIVQQETPVIPETETVVSPEMVSDVVAQDVVTSEMNDDVVVQEAITPEIQKDSMQETDSVIENVVEDDFSIPLAVDTPVKAVEVAVEKVSSEVKVEQAPVDEFEIVDAADIKSLDLSNLPADIILE